jgi:hypothetical protein
MEEAVERLETEEAADQQPTLENEQGAPPAQSPSAATGLDEGTDAPAAPLPRKEGVQKRIDELTREKYELKSQLAYLQGQLSGNEPPPQNAPAKGDGSEPRIDNYASYDEYLRDLSAWQVSQATANIYWQQQAAEAERRIQADMVQARARHADFDEVALGNAYYSKSLRQAVFASEMCAEVAYYLGRDPELTLRLSQLPPLHAAREVGKIEEKLKMTAVRPKQISQAPEPISPVRTGSASAPDDWDSMSLEEMERRTRSWSGR